MSTLKPISFHLGENWVLDFTLRDENGDPIPLTGRTGADIEWRLVSVLDPPALIMRRLIGDGIAIDADQTANAGQGRLVVTRAMQDAAGVSLVPGKHYEHELSASWIDSVQVYGPFNLRHSLRKEFPT